jgi:hypothetical protein
MQNRQNTALILAPLLVAVPMLFSHYANASEDATRTLVALDVDYTAAVSEPGARGAVTVGRARELQRALAAGQRFRVQWGSSWSSRGSRGVAGISKEAWLRHDHCSNSH